MNIYNDYLLGKVGSSNIFTDAHGNKIGNIDDSYTEPTKGFDLVLTIDIEMQVSLERILDNADIQYSPDESIGLIMNPNSSEVYAMSCRPTYDIKEYNIRYIKRLSPIILEDLPTGLSIKGQTKETDCELNPALHEAILGRAVQLAKASMGLLESGR